MTSDQRRQYDQYYTNTTLDNLYLKINELKSYKDKELNYSKEEEKQCYITNEVDLDKISNLFQQIYQNFNFDTILKENYHKNKLAETILKKDNTTPYDFITAYDGDAIRRCLLLIINSNIYLDCYKAYLQYKIIKTFYKFCTKELDDEFFNFYATKLHGQLQQKTIEKRSINIVNQYAGEMMSKLYVKQYFSQADKKSMISLIINSLNILKSSLLTNDWLTNKTKEKAIEKLEKFTYKIGYPNQWKDYTQLNIKLSDNLYQISKKAKLWSLDINFYQKINS